MAKFCIAFVRKKLVIGYAREGVSSYFNVKTIFKVPHEDSYQINAHEGAHFKYQEHKVQAEIIEGPMTLNLKINLADIEFKNCTREQFEEYVLHEAIKERESIDLLLAEVERLLDKVFDDLEQAEQLLGELCITEKDFHQLNIN